MAKTSRIRKFFLLLLIPAVLATGSIFWIYTNPKIALKIAEKWFLPQDVTIQWESVSFSGHHLGGLDFSIDVSFKDLRIKKISPALDLPIHTTRLRAFVFPFKRSARIETFELETIDPVTFKSAPAHEAIERNPFEQVQHVLKILRTSRLRVPVEHIDVKVANFVLQSAPGKDVSTSFSVFRDAAKNTDIDLNIHFQDLPQSQLSIRAELDMSLIDSPQPFLKAKFDFKNETLTIVENVELTADEINAQFKLSGPVRYEQGKNKLTLDPTLIVNLSKSTAHLILTGSLRAHQSRLTEIDQFQVDLRSPLESGVTWSNRPSKLSLKAPLKLIFVGKRDRETLESECACRLPEVLKVNVDGDAYLKPLFENIERLSIEKRRALATVLQTKVAIETLENKILSVDLKGQLKIDVDRKDGYHRFLFSPQLDCGLTVKRFKTLRRLLDSNGVLIPAPLDVLDGAVTLVASGPVTIDQNGSHFPLRMNLELASKGQQVNVNTDAKVVLNPELTRAHLDVIAKVKRLVLDLPPLNPVDGLPHITSDPRILKKPPEKNPRPPKFKFSFNFEIETVHPGAIHLKSTYFNQYMPVSLKVQAATGGDNKGFVQLQPFDINYLRRTVHVENLTIKLNNDDNQPLPMRGKFRVDQTDYTVFIDVEGTTKNPIVMLSSEPYLTKNEIISVLLYDRTTDQLLSSEAETGGSVQAAIADRAIGLFGLWAFASTPIKSFSYNPVTKVYTATIAVSSDVTAGIDTGWETATQLELRKRISNRWSLTAAWTPSTPEESSTTKLVLQWERRF